MAKQKSQTYPQHARGKNCEALARRYLVAQGLSWVESNFFSPWGEIDLVMQEADSYVFVEVRLRKKSGYVSGIESIDANKQKKICRTAQHYLILHDRLDSSVRFDVVAFESDAKSSDCTWIKNAFECG